MQRALRERGDEEEIVSSIMKFLASLVLNQESRIDYCNDIANGVTLFRETARVLNVYGNLLLNNFKTFVSLFFFFSFFFSYSQDQCPAYVYKGICQLFHVMVRLLSASPRGS